MKSKRVIYNIQPGSLAEPWLINLSFVIAWPITCYDNHYAKVWQLYWGHKWIHIAPLRTIVFGVGVGVGWGWWIIESLVTLWVSPSAWLTFLIWSWFILNDTNFVVLPSSLGDDHLCAQVIELIPEFLHLQMSRGRQQFAMERFPLARCWTIPWKSPWRHPIP